MRNLILSFGILLVLSVSVFAANKNYVEGEVLVKYKNGTASEAARLVNNQFNAEVLQEFPEIGWQLIKLPDGVTVEQALASFSGFSDVETVQPNYIYKLAAIPNDPQYGSLWGMTRIGAPTAWDSSTGSSSVIAAIIDTGTRITHEDLAANNWINAGEIAGNSLDDDNNGCVDDINGCDFARNDGVPEDEYDHGAHVAGTIGAVGNNAKGVAGVNWNIRLMHLKIYDAAGNSTAAKIIQAYGYIRTMKLRGENVVVTNNSYGGCPEACSFDPATKDAIDSVGDVGILNVFAAGNSGSNNDVTAFFPASYDSPSILVVGGSDSNDNRVFNYGANSVDLAAPGTGILSTVRFNDTAYGTKSGTSMATPHVTGAAALLNARWGLTGASLKATLMNNVTQLPQFNGFNKTGGRLNLAAAIQNPVTCTFNISGSNQIPAAGGVFSINVTAGNNCDFSAVSLAPIWLSVSNGTPGSGNGTVNFRVEPNTGAQRVGIIRIAGQNFTVTQSGAITTGKPVLDFDGDGKTDYSVVQNSNGTMLWHNYRSTGGYNATSFGLFNEDLLVPEDYDGDNVTDFAVYRHNASSGQSTFYVLYSSNNLFLPTSWGTTGDVPFVSQDFNGDNRVDFAVTRQVGNQLYWYIKYSGSNSYFAAQFGAATDKPVRGDFDGDGRADLAVHRPANSAPANTFFVSKSSDGGLLSMKFGDSTTDRVVPGDFDGDRKTDFAVWRRTNGVWYWRESTTGQTRAIQFGQNGDIPVPGDYDGDGKTDAAVWRAGGAPNQPAVFYVNRSTAGFGSFGWGQSGMKVPGENF